jgi:hypothetical protein
MLDIKNSLCLHSGCKKRPLYNFREEKKGLYCSKHKKHDMIDIKNHNCLENNCDTKANYNFTGEKKGLYCSKHKKDNMIHVKQITCLINNCLISPCYNFQGERKGIYCTKHKKEGMIDVIHKKCLVNDCNITPRYNFRGEKQGIYCYIHKNVEMINVRDPKCLNEWCDTYVSKKYKGYCLFCFVNMFPDESIVRNYKTKEYFVVEYIKNKFPFFDWVSDKKIIDGCSKRRPDLLLDLGYMIIIIEVDENQHIDYDCSCENKRIMELSQDLGHRPTIFIRFNPDEYKNGHEKISSCWTLNKKGICVLKKSKKDEWIKRLETLVSIVKYWTNSENFIDKTIKIIQLFYDCDIYKNSKN